MAQSPSNNRVGLVNACLGVNTWCATSLPPTVHALTSVFIYTGHISMCLYFALEQWLSKSRTLRPLVLTAHGALGYGLQFVPFWQGVSNNDVRVRDRPWVHHLPPFHAMRFHRDLSPTSRWPSELTARISALCSWSFKVSLSVCEYRLRLTVAHSTSGSEVSLGVVPEREIFEGRRT